MTKRIETGLLLIALVALLCVPEYRAVAGDSSAPQADARVLFEENCAKCHGKDGRAKTVRGKVVGARNLAKPSWQDKESDEEIAAAIKKGPGAMPSFAKKFSQAEIDSLVAYVRSLKEPAQMKK
jgi:mono/diheme cytochrome c family protein